MDSDFLGNNTLPLSKIDKIVGRRAEWFNYFFYYDNIIVCL